MSTMEKPNEMIYNAFIDCVQENQDRFYRLAYSYVKNKESALDIVQNAIYNGLRAIHTLNEPSYVKTWFYRILVNACIDELRKTKRLVPTDPQELPEGAVSESVSREELLDLQQALESLDPESKTIVVLRYFEDMKLSDIADVIGANLSTVKTRLYRALEKLKVELEGDVFKNE